MAPTAAVEEILRSIGDPGRSQVMIWAAVMFNLFHVGMIQQFNILISYKPPHNCKLPDDWPIPKNKSFSPEDESCKIIVPSNDSDVTASCGELGYEYDTLYNENYPVNEFNLVCEDSHYLSLLLSLTFFGVMIGGIIFGPISDRYGRQSTMSILMLTIAGLSTGISYVPNFLSFMVIRILLGVLNQGLQTVCLTYVSELFLPRMRTLTSSAMGVMWALMLPLLALLFYSLGDWRKVHLLMGLLAVISSAYTWFLPESVLWLLNRSKINEAEKVLKMFAKWNKIEVPASLKEDLEDIVHSLNKKNAAANGEQSKSGFLDVIRSPLMRRYTLSLLYVWMTTSCVVFGLSFVIGNLKQTNMYVNFMIVGFSEVILRLCVLYFFMKFGRVKIMTTVLLSSGLITITSYLAKEYIEVTSTVAMGLLIVFILSRNLIACNFTMTTIYTSEIFPTKLRSTGIGLGFSAARLGNVITPQIYFRLEKVWGPAPQMVYGGMTIIASLIMLTLPETFNKPMPNSVSDVEDMRKTKNGKHSNGNNGSYISGEKVHVSNDREMKIVFNPVKQLAGSEKT